MEQAAARLASQPLVRVLDVALAIGFGSAEAFKEFVPSQSAQVATLPGGLYACTKFRGVSAEIPHAWERILRERLPASGDQLDARPCFEHYSIDGEYDEKTGTFTCELCRPIAKL